MGLRTATITITREGRDKGKQFLLTEMPAVRAEDWFIRAMMLLGRSGTDVPPDIFQHGAAGFATIGIGAALSGLGKSPWAEVKPLLDEMFSCVSFVSPIGTAQVGSHLVDGQIEEVATRLQLREEVLALHLGFSPAAKLRELRAVAAALMVGSMLNTSTSPAQSESSSPAS
jgi:hypothetical protein